jgi:hypothetical protein
MPGRPTKYTPETVERCFEGIRLGLKDKTKIAAYADISVDSFDRWRERYATFADGIKKAEAQRTAGALTVIKQAMTQHWQAAAWLLERTEPEQYGIQRHEVSGDPVNPFRVVIETVALARREPVPELDE